MMTVTFLLGILSAPLNMAVLIYYWKSCKELIPFVYFTLSFSDLLTGIAAVLNGVVFTLILCRIGRVAVLFSMVTTSLTILTFRLSSFISLTIAMIRSINIASPFTMIRKKVVVGCILGYMLFWMAYILTEFATTLRMMTKSGDISGNHLVSYFYQPRQPNLIIYIYSQRVGNEESIPQPTLCRIYVFYIGLSIFLPTFLTLIAMSHQVNGDSSLFLPTG